MSEHGFEPEEAAIRILDLATEIENNVTSRNKKVDELPKDIKKILLLRYINELI